MAYIGIDRFTTRVLWSGVSASRSFVARHQRVAHQVERAFERFPWLSDAIVRLSRRDERERYEAWIAAYDAIGESDLAAIQREISKLENPPLLSLVVPLEDVAVDVLAEFATGLGEQVYDRWEVRFVNTLPLDAPVVKSAEALSSRDPRFRAPLAGGSAADAWNAAVESAASDSVVIADPNVALRPHTLFLFARLISRHPDAALIYADDDVIDDAGRRFDHYFKPDWNAELLRSQNYLGDVVCVDRRRAVAAGGFREELDGDAVWGLFLRLTAVAPGDAIHHLPFVLSHRRSARIRTAAESSDVVRAHEQRLASLGEPAEVEPVGDASYRIRYAAPTDKPKVSVIVPTTATVEYLRPCLEGVLNRTSYGNVEVLVVISGTEEKDEPHAYLRAVAAAPNVRTLHFGDRPFNFSRTNNWAAENATGELFCFLNDDTEVIEPDWLSTMVGHVLRDRVGAVGALLLYPNDRIQHAGVVLGAGGVAAHLYKSMPRGIGGYHDRAVVDQDVSCVTAACLLVRREAFSNVEGFDEQFAVAFNDVDFCLRLQEAGWRIVWTPSAQLYHKESSSLGRHDTAEGGTQWKFERDIIHRRWGTKLMSDRHYNPNLSLDVLQLWEPAFPPRVAYPWRFRSTERARREEFIP